MEGSMQEQEPSRQKWAIDWVNVRFLVGSVTMIGFLIVAWGECSGLGMRINGLYDRLEQMETRLDEKIDDRHEQQKALLHLHRHNPDGSVCLDDCESEGVGLPAKKNLKKR